MFIYLIFIFVLMLSNAGVVLMCLIINSRFPLWFVVGEGIQNRELERETISREFFIVYICMYKCFD